MEKIVLIRSTPKKDGLDEVNEYLKLGWEVKHISSSYHYGSNETIAYIVLEYVTEE